MMYRIYDLVRPHCHKSEPYYDINHKKRYCCTHTPKELEAMGELVPKKGRETQQQSWGGL